MFDNIGSKIKELAKIVCWIGIAVSVIIGIALLWTDGLAGILTAVFGSLFSWVGSFVLYGFGQLVENSDTLVARSAGDATDEPMAPVDYKCPMCGKPVHYGEESCEKCGQKLFWEK